MIPKLTYLGLTKNNKKVYVDLKSSHAATHFADDPELIEYVREVLPQVEARGDNVFRDFDLGRTAGLSDLVETGESDEIMYAKRLNRDNYTRFVLSREKVKTSFVTVVLHGRGDDYVLYSAWIGPLTPSFPSGIRSNEEESKVFWRRHALVWGKQQIQEGTETKEWPWG